MFVPNGTRKFPGFSISSPDTVTILDVRAL
jgi:hypothetical protein